MGKASAIVHIRGFVFCMSLCRDGYCPQVTKRDKKASTDGSVMNYNTKRIPSWCDRVLWRSLPGCSRNLQLTEYTSTETVTTSDHKYVAI